jgi:hypothetical protein
MTSAQTVPSGYGRVSCSFKIRNSLSGIIEKTPSSAPSIPSSPICRIVGSSPQRNKAGIVKMIPEAKDELADPTVWDMLCSRMVVRPKRPRAARKNAIVMTAMGMEVLIVSPTRSPR